MHPFVQAFVITIIMSSFVFSFELTTYQCPEQGQGWPVGGGANGTKTRTIGNASERFLVGQNVTVGVFNISVSPPPECHVTLTAGSQMVLLIALAVLLAASSTFAGIVAGTSILSIIGLVSISALLAIFFGVAFAPAVLLASAPGVPVAIPIVLGGAMAVIYIAGLVTMIRGVS